MKCTVILIIMILKNLAVNTLLNHNLSNLAVIKIFEIFFSVSRLNFTQYNRIMKKIKTHPDLIVSVSYFRCVGWFISRLL